MQYRLSETMIKKAAGKVIKFQLINVFYFMEGLRFLLKWYY